MQITSKTIKELKRKKGPASCLMEMIEYKQASLKVEIGPTCYPRESHSLKLGLKPNQKIQKQKNKLELLSINQAFLLSLFAIIINIGVIKAHPILNVIIELLLSKVIAPNFSPAT